MLLLFYYLAPLKNDCLVTPRCLQFTFGDKREVYLQDKSAPLPVTKQAMISLQRMADKRFIRD